VRARCSLMVAVEVEALVALAADVDAAKLVVDVEVEATEATASSAEVTLASAAEVFSEFMPGSCCVLVLID